MGRLNRHRSHDPSRPKSRAFFSVKSRRKRVRVKAVDERRVKLSVKAIQEECDDTMQKMRTCVGIFDNLEDLAAALWSTDYHKYLDAELDELSGMGLMDSAVQLKGLAPPSTYDLQRRRKERHLPERLHRMINQARSAAATAVRQANQQKYPFSVGAQSVASMTRRLNVKDWNALLAKRQLLSRTTTIKLIRSMMTCKPPLPYDEMPGVSFFIYDQCYKKKGKSRGEHRAAERVDASGDLIDLISMVIINSIQLPIPNLLAGGLTQAERNSLFATGPYTKPFINVLRNLSIDTVTKPRRST